MNLCGQKVEANWGAMIPIEDGFIKRHLGVDSVVIKWDNGSESEVKIEEIHEPGYRSQNGSPIGLFFGEVV
tara:strand:+ start:144 stop:356 length:213 start_codon:yes stop_codon:yes gene_type:complete